MSIPTYQFLFHTTYGAIHLKKELQQRGIAFVMSDVPRSLSSGCGLSLRFEYGGEVRELVFFGETAAIYLYFGEEEYELVEGFAA